jgi:DNA-binding MarR family transcriptional regulator
MLALRGATPILALAKSLAMDRTTLTRNLSLLESKGWIATRDDKNDARSHLASVTARGRAVAHAALPAWREAQSAVAAALGSDAAALQRLGSRRIE